MLRSLNARKHNALNTLIEFDGSKVHCTCEFEGRRYAIVLYHHGRNVANVAPLNAAFLNELGFNMDAAAGREERSLARRAARGEQVQDEEGRHELPTRGLKRKVEVKVEEQKEPSKRPKCPIWKLFLSREDSRQDPIQAASGASAPSQCHAKKSVPLGVRGSLGPCQASCASSSSRPRLVKVCFAWCVGRTWPRRTGTGSRAVCVRLRSQDPEVEAGILTTKPGKTAAG